MGYQTGPPGPAGTTVRALGGPDPERELRRVGWLLYGGTIIAIVGSLNVAYGVGAVADASFYKTKLPFVVGDLTTWGWVLIVIGAIQVVAAFGIWASTEWGRWIGIATVAVNAVVHVVFVAGAPFLSATILAVDLIALYALLVHGGRPATG